MAQTPITIRLIQLMNDLLSTEFLTVQNHSQFGSQGYTKLNYQNKFLTIKSTLEDQSPGGK